MVQMAESVIDMHVGVKAEQKKGYQVADGAEFIALVSPRPYFHPVIDLWSGHVLGYEILSRGNSPYETPQAMFTEAKRLGLSWELEKACRVAALHKIAGFDDELRTLIYFLNVTPDSFSDPRFTERFTESRLREYGLDVGQIVIEVTEEKSFEDYERFKKLVTHYVNQGFKISLDDFGAGYSGLIALIACTPHFLKLDMAIVRNVCKDDYKQRLVKSICAFAASVNAKLIAEGVETWEELDVLVRFGVRYAQGFLFGKPSQEPRGLARDERDVIMSLVKKYDQAHVDVEEKVRSLVLRPVTVQEKTMYCRDLDNLFKKSPHVDHLVVLNGEYVVGLITRQHFYLQTGGAFGYHLYQKKFAETVCKYRPLSVRENMTITSLAKLAMDRFQEDLYDPVLVVDDRERFVGSVTMKQVVTKAIELEVRCAKAANPLTNLPGNEVIRYWIGDALQTGQYTIIYADLDNFKGFNDTYGFLMGDELIRLTARVLSTGIQNLHEQAKLGHIGGDDFIIVCPGFIGEDGLDALCRFFDQAKLELFKREHVRSGFFEVVDRQGNKIKVPLVTMSLAVIDSRHMQSEPHHALFSEIAASLKKKVKVMTQRTGRSGYMIEQRSYHQPSQGPCGAP